MISDPDNLGINKLTIADRDECWGTLVTVRLRQHFKTGAASPNQIMFLIK